ncbi:MAG: M48 family metalloprotease, partial [Myxococcales bacterium]|nr:M48 family metalloprotease [Myxococcales bacterium]
RAAATRALLLSPLAAAPLVGLALPARLAPGTVPWAVLGAAVCAFFAVGGGVLFGRALGLLRPAGARLRGAVAAPARPGGRAVRLYEAPLLQANAFALPLLRTVIVTRPALDALDDDELAATCRHELEHLDEPRAVALARFGIAWGVGLALASVRQVHAAAGLAGLGGTLLVLVALGALHTRLGRAMEARADRGGHDHGPAYARALEKLYAWNLVPAVLPRKMLHGHLYDRLLAAGVTPGYPRPAPPVRARGPLLLVVAVALGAVVALFVLREAATRPGEESEATALRALALRGDHHALGALAYVRLAAGAAEDALTLLRAAEELAPEEPFYPLTQARILAAADACEPARDLAARAAELGAPGHEIRIALAPCPTRAPERLVSATFARAEPPGREARVFFTVTNLGDRPIETLFSVAYYYDRAGRLLRRTPPFSADEDLGAHETREIALDWVAAMPRTAAIAEAEIDEVRFADGGRWHNAALTPERRPRGGVAPR